MISREEHPMPWTIEHMPYTEAELWDTANEMSEEEEDGISRQTIVEKILPKHHYALRSAMDLTMIDADELRVVLCKMIAAEVCPDFDHLYNLLWTTLNRIALAVSLELLDTPGPIRELCVRKVLAKSGDPLLEHFDKEKPFTKFNYDDES